ncbi:MAG: adenosylcobalamin-dependent ribonucleoside-diphosphate reductase [Planctomycetota bacterium]|nr:adenosylcobalamin-dependent ribonucleoside-diphosphate reductase [Planctomycetota bacterium]
MKISRRFTNPEQDVFDTVEWTTRSSRISNADGSVVFEMNDARIPSSWSQLATDIVVSKYFRKAGVPQFDANGQALTDENGTPVLGPERSVQQVVTRLASCWRHWGERYGYFSTPADANAFEAELSYMLLHQMAAPNSPQWFNTGLNLAYGITGPAQGHFIPDHSTGSITLAPDAYTHPQPHACFIQRVGDDLVGEGGIMDLWTREARLFKYGSGTGTNFSQIRGEDEPLSGGGRSSGLMSFLKIGDRAAGAIKSGGTTRRAAKMVCLDLDHPDIEAFVDWKVREELKVAALVEGMKQLPKEQQDLAAELDLRLDYDFNGEAYYTVSGQNSNNSVRISDDFFDAVDAGSEWNLVQRTDGEIARSIPATGLWERICFAAWKCADPGVQYDSTINAWHTCPEGGRINASNPCSEYMFLDDTACNLASINLLKFYDPETRTFDLDGYEHAIGLWTIVLEISVLMASFPSEEIARRSWKYRTLGLGYANLGAMLMQAGIPYDSESGRAIAGALTAILTGRSYAASALLAAEHGPFAGFEENREHMMRVIRNHRRAAHGTSRESGEYESLRITPGPIDHDQVRDANFFNSSDMLARATTAWDDALAFGEKFGFRNAQVSVIAPTGTIGLLMDCDTTGVEPDFALVKFKKLAGGGYFKIANQSLRPALTSLGYEGEQVDDVIAHVMGRLDLAVPMPLADGTPNRDGTTFRDFLIEKGYDSDALVALENQLPTVFELRFAFNAWSMPASVLESVGVDPEAAQADMAFDGLKAIGLTTAQRTVLNRIICGTQTVEGAPHLRDEHLAVFDCANKCGPDGERFIAPEGHIRMMATTQPFISGAISKTINLPHEASVDEIGACYRLSWELGLKANALYRDGCKLSQPLNTSADVEKDDDLEADEALESSGAVEAADAMLEASLEAATEETRVIERVVEKVIERPMRRRLPDTRESVTHKFNVAGHEGYLIVGLYEDGTPGELFITMAKEGSTIGGLMDSLGTAISVALQYGVPVQSLVTKFAHQRFEPMGMTTNSDIPFAKSLVDYIFRWFGMQFVPGYREQNAPRRTPANTTASSTEKTKAGTVKEDIECKQSDSAGSPAKTAGTPPTSPTSTSDTAASSSSSSIEAELRDTIKTTQLPDGTTTTVESHSESLKSSVLNQSNAALMGDAPACDVCGSITVRNGTCYKCLNCGNSMGCS